MVHKVLLYKGWRSKQPLTLLELYIFDLLSHISRIAQGLLASRGLEFTFNSVRLIDILVVLKA